MKRRERKKELLQWRLQADVDEATAANTVAGNCENTCARLCFYKYQHAKGLAEGTSVASS
jgi:hypothetical protein